MIHSLLEDDSKYLESFTDIEELKSDLVMLKDCRCHGFIARTDEGEIDVTSEKNGNLPVLNGELIIDDGIDGVCNFINHLELRIAELEKNY